MKKVRKILSKTPVCESLFNNKLLVFDYPHMANALQIFLYGKTIHYFDLDVLIVWETWENLGLIIYSKAATGDVL